MRLSDPQHLNPPKRWVTTLTRPTQSRALAIFCLSFVAVSHVPDLLDAIGAHNALDIAGLALLMATCGVLILRHRTMYGLALTVLASVISAATQDMYVPWVCFLLIAFASGYASRRRQICSLLALYATWGSAFAMIQPQTFRPQLTGLAPLFLLSLYLGHLVGRGARSEEARGQDRARYEENRRQERLTLARELHHNVARTMTLAQMNAALLAEKTHQKEARVIAALCEEGVEDLRRLMGTLTAVMSDAAPHPGWEPALSDARPGVQACAERLRTLGHTVRVRLPAEAITGTPAVTVVRVMEEATANIARHAGPSAKCSIILTRETRGIRVRITNTVAEGQAAATRPDSSTGLGLPALGERLSALEGTFEAGPGAEGFWIMEAYVPTTGTVNPPDPDPGTNGAQLGTLRDAPGDPEPHDKAKRPRWR